MLTPAEDEGSSVGRFKRMNPIRLLVCLPHYKPLPLSPQHESIKGLNPAPLGLVESFLEYKANQNPDTALLPILMITHR